jgi:hypothetical protein
MRASFLYAGVPSGHGKMRTVGEHTASTVMVRTVLTVRVNLALWSHFQVWVNRLLLVYHALGCESAMRARDRAWQNRQTAARSVNVPRSAQSRTQPQTCRTALCR